MAGHGLCGPENHSICLLHIANKRQIKHFTNLKVMCLTHATSKALKVFIIGDHLAIRLHVCCICSMCSGVVYVILYADKVIAAFISQTEVLDGCLHI